MERVSAGVLDAQLGVVAVRFDFYDCASNGAADGYERPACEVGGGIEFDNPRATEKAHGAPSVQRRDHLVLFAFGRIVDNEEGCHSVTRTHELFALELGARHDRLPASILSLNLSVSSHFAPLLSSLVLKD